MEYGFLSLVPPLLTIALALITKNVFISLFIGIMTGSLVLNAFSPIVSFNAGLNAIVGSMSGSNVIVIASCLIVGAVIHLMERSGGIEGFVNIIVKKMGLIKTKRGANLFTAILGLAVFTSGSLSCMVTGAVSRPVNDALKVPHEKSAFIVHATSTPWCVLFPFSGWLASLLGYITQSGDVTEAESMAVLFQSIGLNFYCILAIAMVFVLAFLQKDIGPMALAEKRAAETGLLDDPARSAKEEVEAKTSGATPRACNLLAPIGVLVVTIFAVMGVTGYTATVANGETVTLHAILSNSSSMTALLWAVVLALLTIIILTVCQKVFTLDQAIAEMFNGMGHMLSIAFILLLGFTMGTVVKTLGTGAYLSYLFEKLLNPALLPALTFLIALLISFATGTSMGTMAIMASISVPMAATMGVNIPLVVGAMFGGSIFGDHCSPISDTTIMTCSTTGCDIIDHVKTQMPYTIGIAVASMVLYVIFGFVM